MSFSVTRKTTFQKPVEVLVVKWQGCLVEGPAIAFPCTGCCSKLGKRRFAIAWVSEDGTEKSMRLCEDCGIKAESALNEK